MGKTFSALRHSGSVLDKTNAEAREKYLGSAKGQDNLRDTGEKKSPGTNSLGRGKKFLADEGNEGILSVGS